VVGRVCDFNSEVKLLNCYGPYANMEEFWNLLADKGFLGQDNLLIGGP
jgi:hypothetical protein